MVMSMEKFGDVRAVALSVDDLVQVISSMEKLKVQYEDLCGLVQTHSSVPRQYLDRCELKFPVSEPKIAPEVGALLAAKLENSLVLCDLAMKPVMDAFNSIPKKKGGEGPSHSKLADKLRRVLGRSLSRLSIPPRPDTSKLPPVRAPLFTPNFQDGSALTTKFLGFSTVGGFMKGHGPSMPNLTGSRTDSLSRLPALKGEQVPVRIVSGDGADAKAFNQQGPRSPSIKANKKRSRRDRNKNREKALPAQIEEVQYVEAGTTPNKIPEDGFLWRKYGNKNIKNVSHKRGYYKCRHFKEEGCQATKFVQQTEDNAKAYQVTYRGDHTCSHAILARNTTMPLGGDTTSLAHQITTSNDERGDVSIPMTHPLKVPRLQFTGLATDMFSWGSRGESSSSVSDEFHLGLSDTEDNVDSGLMDDVDLPLNFPQLQNLQVKPSWEEAKVLPEVVIPEVLIHKQEEQTRPLDNMVTTSMNLDTSVLSSGLQGKELEHSESPEDRDLMRLLKEISYAPSTDTWTDYGCFQDIKELGFWQMNDYIM